MPHALAELLVSVRNLDEAAVAVAMGVSIVDFKEPSRGPLAACDPDLWQAAAAKFPGVTLSAALGESASARELAPHVPASFRFAKIGPSGHASTRSLVEIWRSAALPDAVELVPVAYADHKNAGSPPATDILQAAVEAGHCRWLIDTFAKNGRTLLDHLSLDRLAELLQSASAAGLATTLAGSMTVTAMKQCHAGSVIPQCWGVRGDVCTQTDSHPRREGSLAADRIGAWQRILHKTSRQFNQPTSTGASTLSPTFHFVKSSASRITRL